MRRLLFAILLVTACASSAYAEDYWVYIKQADEIAGTDRIAGLSQKGDIVDVIPCSRSTGTPATPGYLIVKVSNITEAQRNEMLKPYTEIKTVDGRQVQKPLAYRLNRVDVEAIKKSLQIDSKTSVLSTAVTADKISTTKKTAVDLSAMEKEARLYDMTMPVRVAKKTILDLILPQARAASLVRYVNTASAGGNGTTNATSGTDAAYASLNLAEDAEDGDLTDAGGDTLTINCSGTSADTTAVTFDGWTTSATCYVNIVGDNAGGKWDTSKYRLTVSTGTALQLSDDNIFTSNLQISISPPNSDGYHGIVAYLVNNVVVKNCVIKFITAGYNRYAGGIYSHPADNGTVYVFNNVIYDFVQGTNGCYGIGINGDTSRSKTNVYSNTVYGCYIGISVQSRECNAKNNLCNGNTTDYSGVFNTTVTNLSEDATSPQTTLRSKAVSFVDEANDDFHLSSSDTNAKDAGTDTSAESAPLNFTTDIDGQTRSGTWDIGADEYVAAGGGSSNPIPEYSGIAVGIMKGVYR